MFKSTLPGEDHRHVVVVRGVDDVLIIDGAAGLDDGLDAGAGGLEHLADAADGYLLDA